jgi:hypothetical protein
MDRVGCLDLYLFHHVSLRVQKLILNHQEMRTRYFHFRQLNLRSFAQASHAFFYFASPR